MPGHYKLRDWRGLCTILNVVEDIKFRRKTCILSVSTALVKISEEKYTGELNFDGTKFYNFGFDEFKEPTTRKF